MKLVQLSVKSFLEAKEIIKIKSVQKVSYAEAVRSVRKTQIETSKPDASPNKQDKQNVNPQEDNNNFIKAKDLAILLFKIFTTFSEMKSTMTSRTFFVTQMVANLNELLDLHLNRDEILTSLGIGKTTELSKTNENKTTKNT